MLLWTHVELNPGNSGTLFYPQEKVSKQLFCGLYVVFQFKKKSNEELKSLICYWFQNETFSMGTVVINFTKDNFVFE